LVSLINYIRTIKMWIKRFLAELTENIKYSTVEAKTHLAWDVIKVSIYDLLLHLLYDTPKVIPGHVKYYAGNAHEL
jgi:hypothetical protein